MTLDPTASDLLARIAHAGRLLLLAPSSYLGNLYLESMLTALRERVPGIEIVAVDELWVGQGHRPAQVDRVIAGDQLGDWSKDDLVVVNAAYSPRTWLVFERLADAAGLKAHDLTELMYALDTPLVYQSGARMRALTLEHAEDFSTLRARLADDHSQATLDAVLAMRLQGRRAPLLEVLCHPEQEYFSFYRGEHPIQLHDAEHYVDIGTYDGDTLGKFLDATRGRFASIHAFEPDPANFATLQRHYAQDARPITLHQQAVSDTDTPLWFAAKGTMGSRIEDGGNLRVECVRLDDVLDQLTLLKMDVEGHEAAVLRGAAGLIARCRPRMAITCYHHACDLLDIVQVLDEVMPGATLRLRHYSMYFYDTILYVE